MTEILTPPTSKFPAPATSPKFGATDLTPSQAGIKSGISRRQHRVRLATIDRLTAELLPAVERLVAEPKTTIAPEHARSLQRIQGHLDRIDEAMDTCKTAAEWRDLSAARAKLFESWAWLAGIPKPIDHHKPGKGRGPRALPAMPVADLPEPEVIEAQETPPEAPLSLPETTTGSVPECGET